jgi:hypothetical protein
MKAIAGAVVIFAGAVLFAGGAIADAVAEAAKTEKAPGGILAMILGVGVGLAGAFVLGVGWNDKTDRRAGTNGGAVPR